MISQKVIVNGHDEKTDAHSHRDPKEVAEKEAIVPTFGARIVDTQCSQQG
jgi:hypothetical protein